MPATATKTWYRPGLIFKAKPRSRGHQEICRSKFEVLSQQGVPIDTVRELSAEFAVHGAEYQYTDPMTENTEWAADIRYGYFDLDAQAELKDWDDDDKEIVARHMLRAVQGVGNENFELYSKAPSARPWPTYDESPAAQIAVIATATGTLAETLAYEQENKARKTVVDALTKALAEAQAAPSEEELSAE